MSAIDRTMTVRLNTAGRELFWAGGNDEEALVTIGDLIDLIDHAGDDPADLECDGMRVTLPGQHEYSGRLLIGEVVRQ